MDWKSWQDCGSCQRCRNFRGIREQTSRTPQKARMLESDPNRTKGPGKGTSGIQRDGKTAQTTRCSGVPPAFRVGLRSADCGAATIVGRPCGCLCVQMFACRWIACTLQRIHDILRRCGFEDWRCSSLPSAASPTGCLVPPSSSPSASAARAPWATSFWPRHRCPIPSQKTLRCASPSWSSGMLCRN